MTELSCAEVEELAAELALGTLPGDQRAAVLGHLEGCAECQRLVSRLADTADRLLLLAPEVEPPPGFAGRAMRRLEPAHRRRWRPAAVAAAAALVLGLVAGDVAGRAGLPGSRSGSAAMVQVASFTGEPGDGVTGQVYARADQPAWVFMTVHDAGAGEPYACHLVLKDGRTVAIGSFSTQAGIGSWGHAIDVTLAQVRQVQLVDAQGKVAAIAALHVS